MDFDGGPTIFIGIYEEDSEFSYIFYRSVLACIYENIHYYS